MLTDAAVAVLPVRLTLICTLLAASLTLTAAEANCTVEAVLPAWLTVNVRPATVNVPERGSADALAATE
jgi:hypothetical protein